MEFLSEVNDIRNYLPRFIEYDMVNFSKFNILIDEINKEREHNNHIKKRPKSSKHISPSNKENPKNIHGTVDRNDNLPGYFGKVDLSLYYYDIQDNKKEIPDRLKAPHWNTITRTDLKKQYDPILSKQKDNLNKEKENKKRGSRKNKERRRRRKNSKRKRRTGKKKERRGRKNKKRKRRARKIAKRKRKKN